MISAEIERSAGIDVGQVWPCLPATLPTSTDRTPKMSDKTLLSFT
jgi:hypothetical protein